MRSPLRVPAVALLAAAALGTAAAAQCPPAVLTVPSGDHEDEYGDSVAIDGDVLVVGNPRRLINLYDGDSVAVFRRTVAGWTHEATLAPSDQGSAVDYGESVAVAGDTILIGDPGQDGATVVTGAAYVVERIGGQWVETQKLFEVGGGTYDQFGYAVALSPEGDRAVIGVPHFNTAGRVLVYERQGASFALTATILDPWGFGFSGAGWNFGASVDVEGDRLVIGNPMAQGGSFPTHGAAYVYGLDAGTWKLEANLSSTSSYSMGASVALSGDVVVVGAPGDGWSFPSTPYYNRVHPYRLVGGQWTLESLTPVPPTSGSHVGWSVAVDGDLLAFGEPFASGQGTQTGRVHAYRHDGSQWVGIAIHDGAAAFDQLGRGVALSEGYVAMGAPEAYTGAAPGLAPPFHYSKGPGRVEVAPLPLGGDLFGDVAAVSLLAGGAQGLALSTCPPQPDAQYLLLGSLSGTSPGIPVDGVVLPLAFDTYTTWLLSNPSPAHLPGSFGTLDAAGAAGTTLTVPAGSPAAWAGAVFQHAFAVISMAGGTPQVVQVSDAAALALVP